MKFVSFKRYLEFLRPYISELLISSESFSQIVKTASILPDQLTLFNCGFECDLGNPSPDADFLASYSSTLIDRSFMNSCFAKPEMKANQVWQATSKIFEKWQDKKDFIYYRLDYFWFEFDLRRGEFFTPAIFFGPMIYTNSKYSKPEQFLEIFRRTFSEYEIELSQKVVDFVYGLPDKTFIFQVGLMPARDKDIQRYCLSKVTEENLRTILETTEYKVDVKNVMDLYKILEQYSDFMYIDLDYGVNAGSKVGIECYFKNNDTSKLKTFLEFLVKENLSTEVKANSIIDYNGIASFNADNHEFSDLFNLGSKYYQKRYVHHIKIVYEEGKDLTAKVYLALNLLMKND